MEFPRLDDKQIIEGYRSASNSGHDSQFDQRVKSFELTLKRNRKSIPSAPAHILDIGCAGGAFVEAAQNLGYQVEGIEPSVQLVKAAINRGLNVREGTAETIELTSNEKYDIVTLWDVIEHVLDPALTLDSSIRLLKPEGFLIINIPDIGTALARIIGKRNWWISSVHLYHFSSEHIRVLLKSRGFEVISKRRFYQSLSLHYLLDIAIQMKIPFARLVARVVPKKLGNLPIPYYASQTTLVAKRVI
jgi:SAM-dependent methyltransferase